MIDRATINRIMDAADIVDVVKEFVTLRKAGVNYKGLCPFHNEKTPSFVVSPSKQLCKCFSCGKGGNAVHFVMEHEQMSYPEAIKWLGRKYGIEVEDREQTDEERQAASERESMFILNEWAKNYFIDVLNNHVDGRAIGMNYFRKRGFRDDIIKKFQLGFSLSLRDALAKEALGKGYKEEYLLKTGLCYKTDDGRVLDRYHGRVIFPVHTISGKVVAFGGRILNTDAKAAKYVNSPESEIYHKSNELYGLFFAKHSIAKQDRCYLVEGYTDVISMHQSGVENVVASSGTSLTSGQIRLLHRFTRNITVLYDGDNAGIKASLRGIDMLLAEGMNIKVLLLPDGEDPDSFARAHTAQEFRDYIDAHQVDFITFKTNLLLEDCGGDPVKRAELINDIVKSVSVIPDAITRQMYIRECASLLSVDERLVAGEVGKAIREGIAAEEKSAETAAEQPLPQDAAGETGEKHESAEGASSQQASSSSASAASSLPTAAQAQLDAEEKLLIAIVIQYGERKIILSEGETTREISIAEFIAEDMAADELTFRSPLCNAILKETVENIAEPGFVAAAYFLMHPDTSISRLAVEVVESKQPLSKFYDKDETIVKDEDRLEELTSRLLLDFKYALVRRQIKEVMIRMRSPEVAENPSAARELILRFQSLSEVERLLAKALGDRVLTL